MNGGRCNGGVHHRDAGGTEIKQKLISPRRRRSTEKNKKFTPPVEDPDIDIVGGGGAGRNFYYIILQSSLRSLETQRRKGAVWVGARGGVC